VWESDWCLYLCSLCQYTRCDGNVTQDFCCDRTHKTGHIGTHIRTCTLAQKCAGKHTRIYTDTHAHAHTHAHARTHTHMHAFGPIRGLETTKTGGCTQERCPRNPNAGHLARDMAILQCRHPTSPTAPAVAHRSAKRAPMASEGCLAGVWANLRGGNHQNGGVAPRKSAFRIADTATFWLRRQACPMWPKQIAEGA